LRGSIVVLDSFKNELTPNILPRSSANVDLPEPDTHVTK
jgi:hypothetical protein